MALDVLYEDNHIIAVNKRPSELAQGDKTGDEPMSDAVKRIGATIERGFPDLHFSPAVFIVQKSFYHEKGSCKNSTCRNNN